MSRPLHGRRQLNSFYSPGLINSPMGRGGLPHGRVAFFESEKCLFKAAGSPPLPLQAC